MATAGGPDIIEDGLVLALDAANTKSFRGEPTENLASTDNSRTFFKHDSASVMTFSDAPEKGEGWKKIVITERSANNFRRAQFPYISHPDGVTRTYSLEYDVENLTGYGLRIDGTSGYNTTSISGKGKYTFTLTPTGTKTAAVFLTNGSGLTTGLNDIIYYRYYQVENKSTATRFTTGTRGTTVATGGGWADISGNDNHGEILNGTTTSNDESALGALDFDGTNDYVATTLNNPSGDWIHSIVFWMKLDSNQSSIGSRVDPFSIGSASDSRYSAMDISNNNVNWYFYNNDTRTYSNLFSANTWYHIALTYTGGGATTTTKTMYINGAKHTWGTNSGTSYGSNLNIPANASLNIARDGGRTTAYFPGQIAMFKVYSTKALTASEVLQNYNATKGRFGL